MEEYGGAGEAADDVIIKAHALCTLDDLRAQTHVSNL